MFYIERLPNGVAKVYYEKPEKYDIEIEELPTGEGILMLDENMEFYFDSDCLMVSPNDTESITDHDILMTLLGVTE